MKKLLTTCATLLFLSLLLIFPKIALAGAKSGLLLWFNTVLPTLLPFLIISNLIVQFRITDCLTSFLHPIVGKLFHISKSACYPMIIGMLSGYPVGAKACGDLVRNHEISREEGQFLLCFCNNASPMFILSFVTMQCLHIESKGFLLLGIIYGSGIFAGFLYRILFGHTSKNQNRTQNKSLLSSDEVAEICTTTDANSPSSPFMILDNTILNAFVIITKVGGYIILFSILAEIVQYIAWIPPMVRYFIIGFLEITTGTAAIGISPFSFTQKIVLINALTAFGGLSSHAQTFSVIMHSGLSIKKYFVFKCINAGFAAMLTLLFIRIHIF